tara:strand:- start:27045 stop:28094 length:1050 start_codon:yes stop_codon:yes gene_type:complete
MNFLAGDIGGTKTLLAIYHWDNGLQKRFFKKYNSTEWDSFYSIVSDFISNLPKDIEHPICGCIGVAGIILNNFCKVTNLDWEISSLKVRQIANLRTFELINDFSVLIYGIKYFKETQYTNIQVGNKTNNNYKNGLVAILGAGTGLGLTRGLINSREITLLPSEGGHCEFSPRSEKEWEISKWLKKDLQLKRLSLEKVISGCGLGNLGRWRLMKEDAKNHPLRDMAHNLHSSNQHKKEFPALISQLANAGDEFMQEVLQIWLSAYGSAAGDIALQELCYGGLWIAGGTAPKQLKGIKSVTFLEAFKNKGRFRNFIETLNVKALIDPEAGLFSAGCRSYLLASEMGDLSNR